MKKELTALIILDGYGYTQCEKGNAVELADTPYLDCLTQKYPHTLITASGLGVGLPEGQMGNSEVGHLNLGAGRIIYQELTRITKSIDDGDFFENEALLSAVTWAKENNKALHLIGLLSDGGVHSHEKHLYGLLELARRNNLTEVFVHCLMDGRDTAPNSGLSHIKALEEKMQELGVGKIATITGRYYAMDRDNRWDRVEKAYNAMTMGQGIQEASAGAAMEKSYAGKITDEFILPTVIGDDKKGMIKEKDAIIFFNFRPDRAREITRCFIEKDFDQFERQSGYLNVKYVTMTQYDKSFENIQIAYKPEVIKNTLGEYLSGLGVSQLRIAETEKYAHVTYFFNGGLEKQYPLEDRILVPSPHVATYDLQPEMSAYEVAEKAVAAVESEKYQLMVLNFANADMVGHSGILEAAEKAVEAVNECAKKVIEAILAKGGSIIVTADHGNAEKMIDYESGMPFTAHTSNPVKCILLGQGNVTLRDDGKLADIAPTLLELMELPVPSEMTGTSLIDKS
ncbi:2,3-bisphosphoglycerate-independent phosphoglycerate mutase [Eubacteriaceae bacterium ES3]|nr:2,3-bisphosphoglycerate-independent phosphoglycerate mutase [Eubacteriaceae bacterium ES3]